LSRIGKLPIPIPDKVEVNLDNNLFSCKGPKGELKKKLHADVLISIKENQIQVNRPSESKKHRSLHGLTRSLVANMVIGVSQGFQKKLEIVGVGYRAEMKGKKLLLNLGFSHTILMSVPDTISITCPAVTEIIVDGIDKELVGLIAAKIRSLRKPEPYKGKGIRYAGEHVRQKAGKTGAA
jgi:large subunit ribosomal protein L6